MFVGSDDILKPGALDLLGNAHDDCGTDFVTASYDNISEDGLSVTPIVGKRSHRAPWGRIYSRDIWCILIFLTATGSKTRFKVF